MIALLVTIEKREPGPLPIRSSDAVSASSSAARVAAICVGRGAALDQQDEPVVLALPVPEELLDTLEECGPQTAQPLLGPELEHPVRLEPRLLGGSPVPARHGTLEPVERGGDDVEVRSLGGVLPGGREARHRLRRGRRRRRREMRSADAATVAAARRSEERRRASSAPRRCGASRPASRGSSSDSMSANAAAAPSRNVIASWISKSFVTRPSCTPRPYSIATSFTNRCSCPARRSTSSRASGTARKPSNARSTAASRAVAGVPLEQAVDETSPVQRPDDARQARARCDAEHRSQRLPVALCQRCGLRSPYREPGTARHRAPSRVTARKRPSSVSSRSARTTAAARAGRTAPASSASSAMVASVAARVKRVGGRNSRTSTHARAAPTSPVRAAATDSASAARSTAVQTVARAAANATSSPPETASAAPCSASRAARCSRGRPVRSWDVHSRAAASFCLAAAPSPRISSVSASERERRRSWASVAGDCAPAADAAAASQRLAAHGPRCRRARAALLDDPHLQPCRSLRHLTGDGGGAFLCVTPRGHPPARG